MPGRKTAIKNGKELENAVIELGINLKLNTQSQYKVGRRLWGRERFIDVILVHPTTKKILGIECKYQGVGGTAEEKIPAVIEDIKTWPIRGLVVFDGNGFSKDMKAYLISTGFAVEFKDLKSWLKLYFGLMLRK